MISSKGEMEVVPLVSLVYLCIALRFGYVMKMCQCGPEPNERKIPNLCFTTLLFGFVSNLWEYLVVVLSRELYGVYGYRELYDVPHKEVLLQEMLNTLFDIYFLTLGFFIASAPWEYFYKTGARVWCVGVVTFLKTACVMSYCALVDYHLDKIPIVQSVSLGVDLCALVLIMVGCVMTILKGEKATTLTTRDYYVTVTGGYKMYTYLLGIHLLATAVFGVVGIFALVDFINSDPRVGLDDDEILNARIPPLRYLEIVVVRSTPLLVLAGVAYHLSSPLPTRDGFEGVEQDEPGTSPGTSPDTSPSVIQLT